LCFRLVFTPTSPRGDALLDRVRSPLFNQEISMAEPKENLLDWLRDAHAMEQQAETMLKGQASRIEHYPVLKARIEEHIQETIGQRELLEGCIKRLGGSPSTIKDVMGKMAAFGQALGGMTASDEIVKGAMAGYVFEHFEIASYTALIAAAKTAGDPETARVCEDILVQEEAMADWLATHLPEVTEEFLVRDATPGVEAKK
jgi:ferritin-like metal-binding protein YciE